MSAASATSAGPVRRTSLLPTTTRVVELGESVATAVAGRYLERVGAQVTRVLPLGTASELEQLEPKIGEGGQRRSAAREWLNHAKELVSLDLATADGSAQLDALVADADVLLIAGTSAEWEQRGVPIDHLRRTGPTSVIGQVTLWGDSGPYAHLRGGELQAQAAGGLMNLIGVLEREPVRLGGHPAQTATGLLALDGVMIALFRRQNTGEGAFFTTSVFESVAYLEWKIASAVQAGRERERRGDDGGGPVTVRTNDGHFALFFVPPNWNAVKTLIDDPRLAEDRFADDKLRAEHQSELAAIVEETTRSQAKKDLYYRAQALGIPAGHVATMTDLLDSPQYKARSFFQTVDVDGVGTGRMPDAPWQVLLAEDIADDDGDRSAR